MMFVFWYIFVLFNWKKHGHMKRIEKRRKNIQLIMDPPGLPNKNICFLMLVKTKLLLDL